MQLRMKAAAAAVLSLALVAGLASGAAARQAEAIDCEGRDAVLVASDSDADYLSATTLAAAIDGCIVLAGPRDGDMTDHEMMRAEQADDVAYVVGGRAAVSVSKMRAVAANAQRLGGKDRIETARLVGEAIRAMHADDGDEMPDGTPDDDGDGTPDDDSDEPTVETVPMIAATEAATGTLTLAEGTWTVTVRNLTALTCTPVVDRDGHNHAHPVRYDSGIHWNTDEHGYTGNSGHAHGEASDGTQHSHDGVWADLSGDDDGKHTHTYDGRVTTHADHRVSGETAARELQHWHGSRHTHGDGYGSHAHGTVTAVMADPVTASDFPIRSTYANPGALDKLTCPAALGVARQAVAANGALSMPKAMVSNGGGESAFSADIPYSEACAASAVSEVKHGMATAANGWAESWTFTVTVPADCSQAVTVERLTSADVVKRWSAQAKA